MEDRTMLNAAPVIDTLVLSSTAPKTNDVLTAQVAASDADTDAIFLRYLWTVNGATVQDVTTTDTSDLLDLSQAGSGDVGQVIELTVTPTDGIESGQPVSASASVAASPIVDETDTSLVGFEDEPFTGAVVARYQTPDAGTYSASIDWGDGFTSIGSVVDDGGGTYRILGDHTYGEWGYYFVNTTLTLGAQEVGELHNLAAVEFHQYTHAYTDPAGNVTQFVYGEDWQLEQETDQLGTSTYYTYNSDGRSRCGFTAALGPIGTRLTEFNRAVTSYFDWVRANPNALAADRIGRQEQISVHVTETIDVANQLVQKGAARADVEQVIRGQVNNGFEGRGLADTFLRVQNWFKDGGWNLWNL